MYQYVINGIVIIKNCINKYIKTHFDDFALSLYLIQKRYVSPVQCIIVLFNVTYFHFMKKYSLQKRTNIKLLHVNDRIMISTAFQIIHATTKRYIGDAHGHTHLL